jgi:hypothetical protein
MAYVLGLCRLGGTSAVVCNRTDQLYEIK